MRSFPFMMELVGLLLIILVYVTQILIPQIRGTPKFPFFNRERQRLEAKLEELRAATETEELKAEIEKIEAKLTKYRRKT